MTTSASLAPAYEEKLIKEMLPTVKRIAVDVMQNLPKNVQLDDLIQEGVLALLSAVRRYDPTRGSNIYSFAVKRIKGAMYDYLRKIDWMPRNLRKHVKDVEKTIYQLEAKLGRYPRIQEIASETGLSEQEVKRALDETVRKQLLRLDDYIYEDNEMILDRIQETSDPSEIAFRELLIEKLREAIKNLSEREQMVLSLRYEKELSLKEIGLILGISESRVSQIHSSAISKVRVYLRGSDQDDNPC